MKISFKYLYLALAMSGGIAAQAQIISWSFNQYGFVNAPGNNGGLPVPNTIAGVMPAANWNDSWNENGSTYSYGSPVTVPNALYDNSGAQTSVALTYACSSGGWGLTFDNTNTHPPQDADGTYNQQLMNGYLNSSSSSPGSLSLANIPYASYEIYVYFTSDDNTRTGTVSLGSTTYDFTNIGQAQISQASGNALFVQTTDTSGANPTANYAIFTGLTGATQTIGWTSSNYGGINGFQIVAVPEPGVLALSVCGLGLLASQWRKIRRK